MLFLVSGDEETNEGRVPGTSMTVKQLTSIYDYVYQMMKRIEEDTAQ